MNGCEKYQELISRLIDGELDEQERSVLAGHLSECGECAALYRAFEQVSKGISGVLVEPPAFLRENVMADIRRASIKKKNSAQLKKLLAAAACVAVILLAAGGILPKMISRSSSTALTASTDDASDGESTVYSAAPAVYGSAETGTAATSQTPAPGAQPEPRTADSAAAQSADGAAQDTEKADYTSPFAAPADNSAAAPADYSADSASAQSAEAADEGDMMLSSSSAGGGMLMSSAPPVQVEITGSARWAKLNKLLDGKKSDFEIVPGEADEVYIVTLLPDKNLEITAYLYENALYYTVLDKTAATSPSPAPSTGSTEEKPTVYLAKCTPADFVKFVTAQ